MLFKDVSNKSCSALATSALMLNIVLTSIVLTSLLLTVHATELAGEIPSSQFAAVQPLSFEKAVKLAQKNDPWLSGNIHKQRALESMSVAVNTLPDPKISMGIANLPTNGFNFNQEAMTQAKVGISQVFPRGDSLALKSKQLKAQSEAFPYQREDREAKVAVIVGSLWLDVYNVQQSIALIDENRALFEKLADVVEASYASAVGKTRQQDIVRAQLELTRLDDRLDQLYQQQHRYTGMLAQWLTDVSLETGAADTHLFSSYQLTLADKMPTISLQAPDLVLAEKPQTFQTLTPFLARHPAVLAINKQVASSKSAIALAEQRYKLEWGVSANYGYRDHDLSGNERADLFSVGMTFDLPIFTENKQDKVVASAVSQAEAVKTEKLLLLREMVGSYASNKGRLLRLKARQTRYQNTLMPQIHDQAEASLTAYTNDDGDFSEVVRSRIAVLNAQIEQLALNVQEQKLHLELNYIFAGRVNRSARGAY